MVETAHMRCPCQVGMLMRPKFQNTGHMFKAEFEFKTRSQRSPYWNSGIRTFTDKRHAMNWASYMERKNGWKEIGYWEHND